MKIKKVKYNGEVEIHYFKKAASQELDSYTLKSEDEPEAKLGLALYALRNFLPELIDVSAQWAEAVVITGVTISYSDGEEFGLVISGKRRVPGNDKVFTFNTPHMPFEEMPNFKNHDLGSALLEIKTAAQRYLDGFRSQQKLPFAKPVSEMTGTEAAVERLKNLGRRDGFSVELSTRNPKTGEVKTATLT